MAKKSTISKVNVNGLSYEDITKLDINYINKLNVKDLKKITSRLVSVANKRVRYLSNSKTIGKTAPALLNFIKSRNGKPFSVKGKDLYQVRYEYGQLKKFLEMKTSTVKGYRNQRAIIKSKLEERTGTKLTKAQENKLWTAYNKMMERNAFNGAYDSTQLQTIIAREIKSNPRNTSDKIVAKLDALLNDLGSDKFLYGAQETKDDWDF